MRESPEIEKQFDDTRDVSPFQRFMLASGNFFFRFRNALFPAVVVALLLFTRPALFFGSASLDRVVTALGVAVTLAGQCFRLLVIGFVYIKRGGKDGRIYAKNLVTEGFYAHTRNPMYVGNFLIVLGLGMIYGAPQVYFIVVPFFAFVYLSIVTAEERYLRQRFGDEFDEYVRNVNRFIPNFRGIRKSLREFHYDWKRALRKDYGVLYETLVAICLTHLWKTYYLYGYAGREKQFLAFAVLIGVLSLLYLLARYLKLTKRLR